jgi:hypothetical protein
MTPGYAKPRSELPWLPYRTQDKVFVINSHNFGGAGGGFTPADITTSVWLDASDSSTLFDATSGGSTPADGGAVARWEDKSGNARHMTRVIFDSRRPTLRASGMNGYQSIEFGVSAVQSNMITPTFDWPRPFTLFAVAQHTGGSGYQRIVHIGGLASDVLGFVGAVDGNYATFFGNGSSWQDVNANTPSTSTTSPCVLAISNNGNSAGSAIPYVNGVSQNTKHGGGFSGTSQAMQIGASNAAGQFWRGYINEVILIPSIATSGEQSDIETYLADKWGI